jgi:hypothetical protein
MGKRGLSFGEYAVTFALALITGVLSGSGSAEARRRHRPAPEPAPAPAPQPSPQPAPPPSSCAEYGHLCVTSADCCAPLFCHFDGYTRWCRY